MKKLIIFMILIITLVIVGIFILQKEKEPEDREVINVYNQNISGRIEQDQVWSGTIYVTEYTEVKENVILTILPGTIVKFKHHRFGYKEPNRRITLLVYGTLEAIGTAKKPIRFTSDAEAPEHGDWWGIQLHGKDNEVGYAIMEYGFTNLACLGGEIVLRDSILRWATGGVTFFGNKCKAVVEKNRIYGGGHNSIEVEGESQVTIKKNHLYGNTHGGVVSLDGSNVTIWNNIIENSSWGIAIQSAHADIRYNTIQNILPERGTAIMVQNLGSATIIYNTIKNNRGGGISFEKIKEAKVAFNNLLDEEALFFNGDEKVIMEKNWFGTANGGNIKKKILDYNGAISYADSEIQEYEKGENITSKLEFDFENDEKYEHLPGTAYDTFLYVYPTDETREVIKAVYYGKASYPAGLAWDGENFWVSDQPDFIHKIDENGSIIKTIEFFSNWPYGMSWDKKEKALWVSAYTTNKICQIGTDGNTKKCFDAPCFRSMGLEFDGEHLWTGCFEQTGTLYKIATDGKLVEKFENLPEAWGIGFDGEYLWISGGNSDYVYKVTRNGKIIGKIYGGGFEPRDCAFVEEHLWCLDWLCEDCLGPARARLFKLKVLKLLSPDR